LHSRAGSNLGILAKLPPTTQRRDATHPAQLIGCPRGDLPLPIQVADAHVHDLLDELGQERGASRRIATGIAARHQWKAGPAD
jgi:hypothetical protein